MKKILLSALVVGVLCANQDKKINIEDYLENNNSVDNTKTEFTSEYQDATKIDAAKGFFNYKEVVYSRILQYRLDTDKTNKVAVAELKETFKVDEHHKKLREEAEKLANAKEEAEKEEAKKETLFAQGYCRFRNDIEVSRLSEYSYLDCEFNDIGNATMAVLIVPDFYAQALVAQPLYISYSDELGNSKRLNTTNGEYLMQQKLVLILQIL